MNTVVLMNAAAGRGRRRGVLECVRRVCGEAGVEVVLTASAEEARERARQAVTAGCERVIAAGGDGTLHFVLNALAGTETALGIIPTGSGNDIARELAVPLDVEAAARLALTAPARRMDLGRAGERYFAGIASFGLDSHANRIANRSRLLSGTALYVYAMLRAVVEFRYPEIELETDAGCFRGPVVLAAVANGQRYGGGMRIAPHARLDDGRLDICIVRSMSRLRLLCYFPEVFSGRHLRHPEVEYFQATRVQIAADRPLPMYLDGEPAGETPVTIEVVPQALKVVA